MSFRGTSYLTVFSFCNLFLEHSKCEMVIMTSDVDGKCH